MAKRNRVLIVDDEVDIRDLVRLTIMLAEEGIELVGEAPDGDSAVAAWRELRPDTILLDLQLPDRNGMDVAEQIHAEDPNQKIILFSAYLDQAVLSRAEEVGVVAWLAKTDQAKLPQLLWEHAVEV